MNELKYSSASIDSRRKIGSSQAVVECAMRAVGDGRIAKVLGVSCTGTISSYEALNEEVRFSGVVNFKVLYSTESGNAHCLDYQADFSDKMEERSVRPADKLIFACSLLDTDIVTISSDSLTVAAVIEVSCEKIDNAEVRYLADSGDGLYSQKENIIFGQINSLIDSGFVISEEYEAKENISRIYLAEASAVIKSCSAGLDSIRVEGEIVTTVTYNNSFEQHNMMSVSVITPFKEEVMAAGAKPGNDVTAVAVVKSLKISCDTTEAAPTKLFRLDMTVGIKGNTFVKTAALAVTDIFSVTHETNITGESVQSEVFRGSYFFKDKVDGTVKLSADMPKIKDIAAITGSRLNIANAMAGHGEVTIEGIVSTSIIYTAEGSEVKNSIAAELPFSLTMKAEGVTENMTLKTSGIISDITCKSRRDSEIEIFAEIQLSVTATEPLAVYVITEIIEGREKDAAGSAIGIYVARANETLWDIGKMLGTSPDEIMRQNPELKMPLTGNEKILVYRPL